MDRAWIDGKATTLKSAILEAAKLLGAGHLPLIAGLGTDVAGTRAAISLAKRLGGVVDHMHAETLLRSVDVMREAGVMLTTPGEVRARADCMLLVGPAVAASIGQIPQVLAGPTGAEADGAVRRIRWICPGRSATRPFETNAKPLTLGSDPADLPVLLAVLRARLAGRTVTGTARSIRATDRLVADLAKAQFGVAVWSAADLDPLSTEMLYGIVSDLNARTRFTSLPLGPDDNALGVLQVCGWMTGFPMRTSFGRTHPEHDPWLFDTRRQVDSGEIDCALWISAYGSVTPEWASRVPTVVLTGVGSSTRPLARVTIEVGRPGVDHAAIQHVQAINTLAWVAATKPSQAISVAKVLFDIASALPPVGG